PRPDAGRRPPRPPGPRRAAGAPRGGRPGDCDRRPRTAPRATRSGRRAGWRLGWSGGASGPDGSTRVAARPRDRGAAADQALLTLAAWSPFGPWVISNSTGCPSSRVL